MHHSQFSHASKWISVAALASTLIACGGSGSDGTDGGATGGASSGGSASGGAASGGTGSGGDVSTGGSNPGGSDGGGPGAGGVGGAGGSTDVPDGCGDGQVCLGGITARAGDTITLPLYAFLPDGCGLVREASLAIVRPQGLDLVLLNEVASNSASICGRRSFYAPQNLFDVWFSTSYFENNGGCQAPADLDEGHLMDLELQIPANAAPGDYNFTINNSYSSGDPSDSACTTSDDFVVEPIRIVP